MSRIHQDTPCHRRHPCYRPLTAHWPRLLRIVRPSSVMVTFLHICEKSRDRGIKGQKHINILNVRNKCFAQTSIHYLEPCYNQ